MIMIKLIDSASRINKILHALPGLNIFKKIIYLKLANPYFQGKKKGAPLTHI